MSQFSSYKKEAEKHSSSRKRDTSIAKLELNELTNNLDIFKEEECPDSVTSRPHQSQVENRPDLDLTHSGPCIDPVSTLGQPLVRSRSGQDQVSGIRSRSGSGQVSKIQLAPKQQTIYEWFLKNGISGYFNKGQIQQDTGIDHPTIRKCISKLQSFSVIKLGDYNPVIRRQEYCLSLDTAIDLGSSNRSGSGQGQVRVRSTSYKTDRQIYNNLSIFLKNSDYWSSLCLTLEKITGWCDQHEICTPEFVLQQLQMGEHHPKVKEAKSPVSYFFKSLLSGGLERPDGFEFPEERAERFKQQELLKQQELITSMEKARQKERELADQESFLMFMADHDAVKVALDEISKGSMTSTLKASVNIFLKKQKIDTRLENRLRFYFQKS